MVKVHATTVTDYYSWTIMCHLMITYVWVPSKVPRYMFEITSLHKCLEKSPMPKPIHKMLHINQNQSKKLVDIYQ